jgi:hypothetical protein
MRVGTRNTELVFLHPMGSASYVLHSGAFMALNVDTLFFMLGWDRYGFQKNTPGHVTSNFNFCIRWDLRVTTCIPVRSGCETLTHYFSSRVGPIWIPQKARRDMLRRASIFASDGICWPRCAFWCVHGVKHRRTIFHARVGPKWFL